MAAETASEHRLPSTVLYSVEYPGYVLPTSIPHAIRTLGGQSQLESAFKRSKEDSLLELNLRPGNPFAHPVTGTIVGTNNILLRVVKRKRKQRLSFEQDGKLGEYKVEAVGIITKTARFRSG
jgi:general transcription factor 3C polypeptide 5 (transcription factor C subunit 1)